MYEVRKVEHATRCYLLTIQRVWIRLISYISLEGDESDVGALETNLITHFRPHTQQAAPFTVWFPSPKVGLAPPAGPLWRTLRSQRNWLAKYRPEASVWDASLNSLLSEGISLLGDAPETPSTNKCR
ncbi:hypothetical protein P8C59_000244 [Phyllachora maydis]|uniref:Uncharacterized protein n=1 Tax=Phyllachora maydis TaxID=1825666 RepID=A0AAD9M8I4_9PEZI|nr:hypothetical protein P8C59_000244 [Phyllachora maydis]